jgi:hypothetical protein
VLIDFWAGGAGRADGGAGGREGGCRGRPTARHELDTDALSDVASQLGILSIPTIAVFHHGRECRASGRDAAAINSFIDGRSPR